MTSAKAKANRTNAQASTGPKTARGKSRAAQNARRHGLSLSILEDPVLSAEAENLADEIAGEGATPEILALARRIAEAQIDLQRARHARHQFLSDRLEDPDNDSRENVRVKGPAMKPFVTSTTQGADKFSLILYQDAKHLLGIERYERRALSRRKFAIRAFDASRSKPMS
jgi:hypothetical protein